MTIHHFPFHIGDFLGGVMHMDGMEIGAYTMLIIAHYQLGREGLPDDQKKMAKIARLSTKQWSQVRDTVLEKFNLRNGFWTHIKVIEIISQIELKSSEQKAKALKRWNSDDATALPDDCQPLTTNQKPEKKEKELSNDSSKKTRGTRLPDDWEVSAAGVEFSYTQGMTDQSIITESDKFRDYWHAVSGQKGVKNDWDATWRNWIRNRKGTKNGAGIDYTRLEAASNAAAKHARTRPGNRKVQTGLFAEGDGGFEDLGQDVEVPYRALSDTG